MSRELKIGNYMLKEKYVYGFTSPVVDAVKYTDETWDDVIYLLGGYCREHLREDGWYETENMILWEGNSPDDARIIVKTHSTNLKECSLNLGDWLMKTEDGMFFTFKDEVFKHAFLKVTKADERH